MNSQIETWRVQQYAANVYHLSQQKGSRLSPFVRHEMFKGKAEFFDRLAAASAQKKIGRNENTPNMDITHSRRMVVASMYEWATLVDRFDKLQNIHSPENEYSIAARNSLGRAMDDEIIRAAVDLAYGGEDGTSTTSLPNVSKVACVSGAALSYANVQGMRKAAYLLNSQEVEGERVLVYGADFLDSLLSQTEVTSSDYNSVKALVQGEIDTYLGFKFIHSERLPLATTYDANTFKWNSTTGLYDAAGTAIAATDKSAFAFATGGIILGMNEGAVGRVDERSDKSYNPQVYASMNFGAVRMEEVKVIQLIYKA